MTLDLGRRVSVDAVVSYRISELAAHTGVPATALRFYDKKGLLAAARTPAGHRAFDDAAADRVRFISAAKDLGLTLDTIRDLLTVWDGGVCREVRDELRALLGDQIVAADGRVADLRTFRQRLSLALNHLGGLPPRDGPCDDRCAPADPPIACSLDADAQRERVDAWRALLDEAEHVPDLHGRTVRFPVARAGTVAALAVAEQRCCPFLTFRITIGAGAVELNVVAPAEAEPVLADLFAPRAAGRANAGHPRVPGALNVTDGQAVTTSER